jgi:hypothetical protein
MDSNPPTAADYAWAAADSAQAENRSLAKRVTELEREMQEVLYVLRNSGLAGSFGSEED